jgi:DNA-directed RNA polymerase subunit RPC12/RpoP
MSDHFINLSCATCGAKLDVYDDMDRFACGYCGNQQIVQRRGGTVALKAVTNAIGKVQIGTDKTAAELAIARYDKELQELHEQVKKAKAAEKGQGGAFGTPGVFGSIVCALVVIVGLTAVGGGTGFFCALGIVVFSGVMHVYYAVKDDTPEVKVMKERISQIESLRAEKVQVAEAVGHQNGA